MNFLNFANPIGWWALFAAVPVVAFYILKTRMRRQQVSTLLFWDRVSDDKQPRAWWQQLRRLLSLVVQLVILMLLIGALVDPLWSWQQQHQRRIVLVVDNSASMRAPTEGDTTRLDMALETAGSLVRSLRGSDQMALLTAGGSPDVALGLTDHQNSLLEALDQISPTDGPTAVAEAMHMGRQLLADFEGKGEIVVLTDAAFDAPAVIPHDADKVKVVLYGVGGDTPNVGITRFQVRRSVVDAVGFQMLVDVTNFSDKPASDRLTFTLGDNLVDVVPLELEPNQTIVRVLDHTSIEGGLLVVELDAKDALAADNRAVALLPRRDPLPVVLVTKGNLFLESVLRSIPLVALEVTSEAPSVAPAEGVLVLDKSVPTMLPKGRVLVVDPQSDCDLWKLGGPLDEPIIATVNAESPLTQHVRLTNVLFPGAQNIEFTTEATPLLQDPADNPLLAQIPRPEGDAVVLTCSLEQGDLPLRIAFPVLMKNAIEWFQGVEGELQPAISAGQMVTVNLSPLKTGAPGTASDATVPADESSDQPVDVAVVEATEAAPVESYVMLSPTGETYPLVTSEERVLVGPLESTGVWRIREGARGPASESKTLAPISTSEDLKAIAPQLEIACNLANPAESDLRPRFQLEDAANLRLVTLGGYSMWYYLTLATLGLVAMEWWLYQRRIVE